MKLQIVTGGYTHYFIPNLEDLIEYFADLGYKGLDLSLDCANEAYFFKDNWKMAADRIKARLKSNNMEFGQAHAPGVGYLHDANDNYKNNLIRSIEVCSYFGIKSLVVHLMHVKGSDEDEFIEKNYEYYKQFLPYLDKYDVDFCFENLGTNIEIDMYCSKADQLLKVINRFSHPHIHACWDTGHGNLTRQNQYDSIVKLGDHLRAIHVHDNLYPITYPDGLFTPDCHNFPLFGNVNFDAVMCALIDIGYKGNFSIETDTPNRRGHTDFVRNGETKLLLKPIPSRIRFMADEMLFEIGKYMLETYGLWED